MSFGGHAWDMNVRGKLNREQLRHRRERAKEYRLRTLGANPTTDKPDITLEQFERINTKIKR